MSERRKFTDSFLLGDEVYVIRHEHGWVDGNVHGIIKDISEYSCLVVDEEGYKYQIPKPRDIVLEPFSKRNEKNRYKKK